MIIDTFFDSSFFFEGGRGLAKELNPGGEFTLAGEDNSNVTDYALTQFSNYYKSYHVTKSDIFYYVYAIYHHAEYLDVYKETLKNGVNSIPFLVNNKHFENVVRLGKLLADIHLNFETAELYPIREKHVNNVVDYQIKGTMKIVENGSIQYNKNLILTDIPQEAYSYTNSDIPAIKHLFYKIKNTTDINTGITWDSNLYEPCLQDPKYWVKRIQQVITISLQTMQIKRELENYPIQT